MGQIIMALGAGLMICTFVYGAILCEKNEGGTFVTALFFMPFVLKKARAYGFYRQYISLFLAACITFTIGAAIVSS